MGNHEVPRSIKRKSRAPCSISLEWLARGRAPTCGGCFPFLRNELFADLPGFRGGIVTRYSFSVIRAFGWQQFWISPFLHRDINRSPVRPAR